MLKTLVPILLCAAPFLITPAYSAEPNEQSTLHFVGEIREKAESGDANAQCALGFMYENGLSVPQDYNKAVLWFTRAAEQGNAKAQSNLGLMYDEGQGVPQDYKQVVLWYTRAAE